MQKTIISWATDTWNPFGGCSRVSDGCKFCYAELLSLRYGHTKSAWTLQNEAENVTMKPHKLAEPFALKESSRVFVNSMSDMFHRMIPDWYRAAVFNVMLSLPQHIFQILTKRADQTADWHIRYQEAVKTPEYRQLAETHKSAKVRAALQAVHADCWGANLWMGTSVEDSRVVKRIDSLRQCGAKTRFLSCEPLIGPLGDVDLSGISWVICGGESGNHLTDPSHPRWMKQEWARELRDNCVKQSVAFFYKQDSGKVTEQRPYLVEADGTFWRWWQYPGDLAKAVQVNAKGEPLPVSVTAENATTEPTFDTGVVYDQPQLPPNPIPVDAIRVEWSNRYVGNQRFSFYGLMGWMSSLDDVPTNKEVSDQIRFWLGDTTQWGDKIYKGYAYIWKRNNTSSFDTGLAYDQPSLDGRNPILCADCSHDFGTEEERRLNPLAETIIVDNAAKTNEAVLCGDCFRKRRQAAAPKSYTAYDNGVPDTEFGYEPYVLPLKVQIIPVQLSLF